MTEQIIPADDFCIGDIVRLDNGDTVEVREIVRDRAGRLIVNPGAPTNSTDTSGSTRPCSGEHGTPRARPLIKGRALLLAAGQSM